VKLAIAQITLGVLITAAAIFISVWGYPNPYHITLPDGMEMHIFGAPATRLVIISVATILLGLAVLGCGTAQLIKARR
jgi:hypothetical protein